MTKKSVSLKKGLTTATRGVVYLMGLAIIVICGILLPELAREEAVGKANPPSAVPFLIGAWILTIPIFFALYQTVKLLSYIDENKAFPTQSVKALQNIKVCAIVFSVLIATAAITVILIGKSVDPTEDVTPVITLGLVFTFASGIVTTFTAVLQRLLKDAIDMKNENDLIV